LGNSEIAFFLYTLHVDPERGGLGGIITWWYFPRGFAYLLRKGLFNNGCELIHTIHWIVCPEYFDESPERRVYKWYIIPKVKEPTKLRINFKTCWILTKRIQFLISYVYRSFWRFLFKIFEHVSFGSLKVTYVLKINKSSVRNYKQQLANTILFQSVVSTRHAWDTIISHGGSTMGYYSISRCIAKSWIWVKYVENHIVTWYKCCFWIGQFEFEV
jgi:hypothetical protein